MSDQMFTLRNIPLKQLHTNEGQIQGVPRNPRFIRDNKFEDLKRSIENSPEMLALRELIVYDNGGDLVIIGGNMRYRAMKELGYGEAPCKVLSKETSADKLREYIIKDNLPYGQNDWSALADEWDAGELADWGMDIPGFDDTEEEEISKEETTAQEDDFDEAQDPVEPRAKLGDIWQLGDHRLTRTSAPSSQGHTPQPRKT